MNDVIQGRDNRGSDFVPGTDHSLDPHRDGSLSREQLWRFMWEMRLEPEWRKEAEVAMSFYDGDQIDREVLMRMKALGMAPIVINMTAPAIDAVAGWEVITRADLKVIPETDESYETATALNVKLKEAMRMTRFNQVIGHQFKQAIQIGVSWIEISRNPDPYGYPFKVRLVPWREVFWDYRSREPDLSDRRYMLRRKWFDRDVLTRHMPQHRRAIEAAVNGFADGWTTEWEELGHADLAQNLRHSLEQEQRWTLEEDEWRQTQRGRVCLYEILYDVPTPVEVLRLRDGRVVQFDREHPLQLEALRRGMAKHQKGVTNTLRQAFYLGPLRLDDHAVKGNRSHYVPMVAYRKDNDGAPYGLTSRMISAQKSINARHTRIIHDTTSRKYFVDDDAVDDHGKTAAELNKVNSYVVLKGDRRGEQGLVAVPATDTTPVTFQMLQEAKLNLFEVTGLHPEFMGKTLEAGRSGIAIETLIEQTTQVLGIVVDNYREAKLRAGKRLMAYLVDDLMDQDDYLVQTGERDPGGKRQIMLNRMRADGYRDNDVLLAQTQVALGEAPSSVTYMQQKFQSLTEIVKSLPEQMQAVFADLIVRAAALPDGEEMLDRIRDMTGFGPEPKDPEKRRALLESQQRQAQIAQHMEEIEIMLAEAELRLKQAQAAHDAARARKTAGADTELTEAKTVSELAKADVARDEQNRKAAETSAKAIEAAARLEAAANQEQAKKEASAAGS